MFRSKNYIFTVSPRLLLGTRQDVSLAYKSNSYKMGIGFLINIEDVDHRRRIELEDKAKVVASVWGTESLPR